MSTVTFTKGTGQSWVVPPGVTIITIDGAGAQGGNASGGISFGGAGGRVQGTLTTTPGETLYIAVGGQDGTSGGGANATGGGATSGVGGGMTWLSRSSTFATGSVLIVGAGGSGAGNYTTGNYGGGSSGSSGGYPTNYDGQGGSQVAGGAGGIAPSGTNGNPGSAGLGGAGVNNGTSGHPGGGGGAGYYGGGGGGSYGLSGNGGAGGGGSSYGSASIGSYSTTSNFQAGDGYLTFTYSVTYSPFTSDQEVVQTVIVDLIVGRKRAFITSEVESIVDTVNIHVPSSQPIITFRTASFPYGLLASPFMYTKTVAKQSGLPILAGESSDIFKFRVYNNYDLHPEISTAYNVSITTYDDTSHSAVSPLVTQQWVSLQENGYGVNSTVANVFTSYRDSAAFVGGVNNQKTFAVGADGGLTSNIPAGIDGDGCGFIEVNSHCSIPQGQSTGNYSAVLSAIYDWST